MGDLLTLERKPKAANDVGPTDKDGDDGLDGMEYTHSDRLIIVGYENPTFSDPFLVKWGVDDVDDLVESIQLGNPRQLVIYGVVYCTFFEALQFTRLMDDFRMQNRDWYLPNAVLRHAFEMLEVEV